MWVTFVQKFEAKIWTGLNVLSCVRLMVWVVIKVSFIDWIGLSGKQIVLGGFKVCSSVLLEYKEYIIALKLSSDRFRNHHLLLQFKVFVQILPLPKFRISIKISICAIEAKSHEVLPLHWEWNWSNIKMICQQSSDLNPWIEYKFCLCTKVIHSVTEKSFQGWWLSAMPAWSTVVPKAILSNWVCRTDKPYCRTDKVTRS